MKQGPSYAHFRIRYPRKSKFSATSTASHNYQVIKHNILASVVMASGYLDSYVEDHEADAIGVGNTLEAMPAEILQEIFVCSKNVYLPQVSRTLRTVLTNERVRVCFSSHVIVDAYWIRHQSTHDLDHYACHARNSLLAQKWFTFDFSSKLVVALQKSESFDLPPTPDQPWGSNLFTTCHEGHEPILRTCHLQPLTKEKDDQVKLFMRFKDRGAKWDGCTANEPPNIYKPLFPACHAHDGAMIAALLSNRAIIVELFLLSFSDHPAAPFFFPFALKLRCNRAILDLLTCKAHLCTRWRNEAYITAVHNFPMPETEE